MKYIILEVQNLYRNPKFKKKVVITFFILSTLFFFSRIFFGLDFSDSFYHLNQASQKFSSENSFTFFLSSLIIEQFRAFTGDQIILLRLINALLIFFSVCIPIFIFSKKVNKTRILFFTGCTLIFVTTLNANILGFDTLSVFFASIIFVVTLFFFKNWNIYLLLTISLLCALNVFIRMPNIYLLPVIFSIFLIQGFNGTNLKRSRIILSSCVYLGVTSILIFLGYIIYFNLVGEFPKTIFEDNYHSPAILISQYCKDLLILFFLIIFILTIHFALRFVLKIEGRLKKVSAFFILGAFSFIIIVKYIILYKYSLNFSLLITAMAISFVLVDYFGLKKKNDISILILFILFLFMIPFGSNTGLLKSSLMIVLFPLVSMFLKFNRIKFWIVVCLLPISIIEGFFNFYEDKNISKLRAIPKIEALDLIQTSQQRADYLESVTAEVIKLKKQEYSVYFYGNKSHIFHFLYNDTSIASKDYFQPLDNSEFISKFHLKVKAEGKIAIFIVDSYPDHNRDIQGTTVIRGLENLNFKKAEGDLGYYIYQ